MDLIDILVTGENFTRHKLDGKEMSKLDFLKFLRIY